MNVLAELQKSGLVAVVRESDLDNIIPICEALAAGGINAIEITAETPGVAAIIEKAVQDMGDKLLVGAGTVLDPEAARSVISAGAKFVVSPTLNIETIKTVKRYGIVSIPGALTPTEILTAFEHGADMVKVFPASTFGPSYVKNIHGPLPQIPLMVTGGINLDNMSEYIQAGAAGIGLGSNLVNPSTLKTDADYEALVNQAKRYRDTYQKAKQM
ncbi:bifunctional 4-hydroxy-2-oxoglutarate aldolase/2-dehydro-3-deoxy-phosphogluconate aldolase [Pseudogracilibacillus auburnensis]|uniref:bifunctional 4-hydroxy-2-oxoglutarate aldolase/2-dehydro-3-deoxy-phosphogluconate aldolase n=1 Tax=Pseudogracilibacillus auburnensis TaxID=1494959 RepID=UPI001A95C625|nr:bifunctional 4-hydroxy-2-oxoglutarate aldolase/2-dehydro-3-deoxy-phosphogluconate aldolase [Pseudogracilibacillus auburnensis]MBO1003974.1 bifunctional 4-hydroxy-2-oxoglutarate aldolase/2-dehydro-3-deoxy-phosphogluconate aldolase [Pseudogracilibacillus auburnensis]